MDSIYYDPKHPAAFGGINVLQKVTRKPRKSVKKYLNKQAIYRKFKIPRKRFKRARIQVDSLGVEFQTDLFDLQKLGRQNGGYKWVLLVVDSFSRYVKCEPLRNKTGPEVARGLDKIFNSFSNENKLAPRVGLGSDLGNEFFNKDADAVYLKHNVAHFPLRAPKKAAMAEISGRYIIERLYKIMSHKQNKRWLEELALVVEAKNSRANPRTANLAPVEIDLSNQTEVHKKLYPNYVQPKFDFALGTLVQVVKTRNPFSKSYEGFYGERVFRVIKQHKLDVPRYTIADEEDGEEISGTWYANELYAL